MGIVKFQPGPFYHFILLGRRFTQIHADKTLYEEQKNKGPNFISFPPNNFLLI
jgi:hypothetical protein